MSRRQIKWVLLYALVLSLLGCGGGGGSDSDSSSQPSNTSYTWHLPAGFPQPIDSPTNKTTEAKVQLGRLLFYDKRLSGNGSFACASCHQQAKAFTDGRFVSIGSTGELHPRNAQSLANVVYFPTLTWANPSLTSLEKQMEVPLFGENPIEMGINDDNKNEVLARISQDQNYQTRFAHAFPSSANAGSAVSWQNVIAAIASFQRTLISGNSTFDQYQQGKTQLTAAQLRGRAVFESAQCFHCHTSEFLMTDQVVYQGLSTIETPFHNTGLYNIGGTGAFPVLNRGLFEHTGVASDMGKFRAPSLRNVEVTAPYMHDGSIATLEEVVEFYSAGGRQINTGSYAGDGRANPYKSDDIKPLNLSTQQKADLVEFLKILTDHEFLTNPNLADPFQP